MGFTFDGMTSREMGIATRQDKENRIPGIRNSTSQLAGRHGLFDFGETVSERKIEIDCLIPPGNSDSSLLELKDKIVEWLNPDKGLCPLILDREPDRQYYARLEDGISFERLVRNTGTFTLSFFCPDPFAYALSDEIFSLAGSGTVKRVKGNVASHPVYVLKAVLADESETAYFLVNGEKVSIKGPLEESETVYIDTDSMTARIVSEDGSEKNALANMETFHFPYLETGENTVTAGADEGSFLSLEIRARSRWL
jgi:predicted phage tail component-like protein